MPFRRRTLPVLFATDEAVQEWHTKAVAGDTAAFDKLLLWVYCEATRYYGRMCRQVSRLTRQDAEDLAAQFVVEFEGVWRDVRSVARYTRSVLKKNLHRHLAALSELPQAVPIEHVEAESLSVRQTHPRWMTLSDREYEIYNALCLEYYGLPTVGRILVSSRLRHPPAPYAPVCRALGLDEAKARVFTNRFLKRVRKRYERRLRSDQRGHAR